MELHNSSYTSDQLEQMNRSRKLNDALFAQGGARLLGENGERLLATDRQIDIIQSATEGLPAKRINNILELLSLPFANTVAAPDNNVSTVENALITSASEQADDLTQKSQPVLVPRVPGQPKAINLEILDKELAKTPLELDQEAVNREALHQKIKFITDPYAGLYDKYIPPVGQNTKNLAKEPKTKIAAKWSQQEQIGDADVNMRTVLKYSAGERHTIQSLEVNLRRSVSYIAESYPTFTTFFENGEVACLSIKGLKVRQSFFSETFGESNKFGNFMREQVGSFDGSKRHVRINAAAETPFLEVEIPLYRTYAYTYDPATNAFNLTGDAVKIEKDHPQRALPESLTVEEYLEILEATTSIGVPAVQTGRV